MLALILLVIPAKASTISEKTEKITGALFEQHNDTTQFICSGFVFEKVVGGYLFATAGHCAEGDNDNETDFSKKQISFQDDESKPYYEATLVGRSNITDIAVYFVETDLNIELIPVGNQNDSKPGATILNTSYMLDAGKLTYYGRLVRPSFAHKSPLDIVKDWTNDMPININSAPGASGSPIIDEERGVIIGILVGGFTYPEDISEITIAIQATELTKYRDTIWDKASMEPITPPPAKAAITPDVLSNSFGKSHPFMLTVHGPSPEFTQAGYIFKADVGGFELSDEYYYASPVYIDMEDGKLRLFSTKSPEPSIGITLISFAK